MSCEYMTVKEIATWLKVEERFIRRMIKQGHIKVLALPGKGKVKTIRICRGEILRYSKNMGQGEMVLTGLADVEVSVVKQEAPRGRFVPLSEPGGTDEPAT